MTNMAQRCKDLGEHVVCEKHKICVLSCTANCNTKVPLQKGMTQLESKAKEIGNEMATDWHV